jgi:hypothetical protein
LNDSSLPWSIVPVATEALPPVFPPPLQWQRGQGQLHWMRAPVVQAPAALKREAAQVTGWLAPYFADPKADPAVNYCSIGAVIGHELTHSLDWMGRLFDANGALRFSPVVLGASDLDGFVQVREGLRAGDQIVTYSEKALTGRSRVKVVDQIAGVAE